MQGNRRKGSKEHSRRLKCIGSEKFSVFSVDNFILVVTGRMETQHSTISFISCCFYIILLSFVE